MPTREEVIRARFKAEDLLSKFLLERGWVMSDNGFCEWSKDEHYSLTDEEAFFREQQD